MTIGHLLGNLLSVDSVRLGRLVLNAKDPRQDFIDPPGPELDDTKFSQNSRSDFKETHKFSKASKLRPYLGGAFSISYERQRTGVATLSAKQATIHDLNNSGAWFEEACSHDATRKFLQNAIDNRNNVYLVVGFRTVHDGMLVKGVTWKKGKEAGGEVPMVLGGIGTIIAVPGATATRDTGKDRELAFQAPGEQIFAIIYRKVTFKWLSSRTIGNMSLEPKNRWKTCWDWRGEEDEEDDDEDDVLEAYLTDVSDLDISDDEDVSEDEKDYPRVETPGIDEIQRLSKTNVNPDISPRL